MSTPDVVVDAFAGLAPVGGIGRYVHDLAHALLTRPDAPPARFACPRNLAAAARAAYGERRVRVLPLPWRPLAAVLAASAGWGLTWDRAYGRPAVVHSTLGYGPRFGSARLINHVHDLTWWDHPEWHPRRTAAFFRATVPHATRAAAVVLTHSRHVASEVERRLGVPTERIVTIPPPLGHAFRPVARDAAVARVRARFGLDEPFVLHVGTIEPRKNHVTLIAAFERMRRAGFHGRLVLVGRVGWRADAALARLADSEARDHVVRLEGLADDDLVALYGASAVVAFPSHEEGFGMPLLESLACGAACVTGDHPALRELGGDDALAVPATDADALADALLAVANDPDRRAALAARGSARAAEYAFDRWAARIFALYRAQLAAAGAAR